MILDLTGRRGYNGWVTLIARLPRITRVEVAAGLLGIGWLALVAAAIGIAATPARWCGAVFDPTGHVALHVGLTAAASALGLSFIPTVSSERRRGLLALAWVVLAVALLVVVFLARVFAGGGYYCG